jgi:N-acyl-phosphatidylethanolamine-hydrolysing phospholipase D
MTIGPARANAAKAIFVVLLIASVGSCAPIGDIIARNSAQLLKDPIRVESKIEERRRDGARLAVLWVGHATLLIQIDDRMILTDPVFTHTVAMILPRLVEPGLDIDNVPNGVVATALTRDG